MAKPTFVGFNTHASKDTTTEAKAVLLTQDTSEAEVKRIARELLDNKHGNYTPHAVYRAGDIGKFAYILAQRNARKTPTIFWVDGDTLRPCTKKWANTSKYARVKARAQKDGVWNIA